MKVINTALLTLFLQHHSINDVSGFTPSASFTRSIPKQSKSLTRSAIVVDPSIFSDIHQHVDTIFSTITLSDASDALVDAATSASSAVVDAATTAPAVVVDAATAAPAAVSATAATDAAAANTGNGAFGFLTGPIEFLLQVIHSGLVSVGMSADAWGVSIVTMTVVIKLLTYPLTKSQLESTGKMQALQPTIKDIQAKYQSNPEVMNQKISEVYQTNNVNPLAGCIPSLVQIPVFIGLYRAVLQLAKDDKLNEPFLWLPNLEGPVYGADPTHASDWILKNWVDGVPPLGWSDTAAFLTIPAFLIVSQFFSMQLMQPKNQEQPAFLKVLPLMIGWFSLNVPAALGIYWVANNIITTALTLQIKSGLDTGATATAGVSQGSGATVVDVKPTTFTPAPMREKPAGFGAADKVSVNDDGMKPITPIDAEIVASDVSEGEASSSSKKSSKRGGKKKKKN